MENRSNIKFMKKCRMGDHFTLTDLNVASVAYWIHFVGHERRDKILRNIPYTKASGRSVY